MAFLGEIELIQAGKEHRIQVNVEQVVEIFPVLAGKGVGSPVRAGESIHKRVEGTADHHKKWVAHRVFFATAQGGMFENMGHPAAILGHRAQGHQKHILGVIGADMNMLGAGFDMSVLGDVEIK